MSIFSIFRRDKKTPIINDNSSSPEAEFVLDRKAKKIGLKSSIMEYAAIKRNIDVERLSRRVILVKPKKGDPIAFTQMNGEYSSLVGMHICNRKHDTRKILRDNGINVTKSKKFTYKDMNEGLKYAQEIGFPVVIKPTTLSRGRGVTANIKNEKEFENAWNHAVSAYKKSRKTKDILVEKHFEGYDYRVFVVGDKVVSATLRKRANVVGDGVSTIKELIQQKNKNRLLNPYLEGYLIPEDESQLDLLVRQNYKLDDVLEKGQELTLRSPSNISAGGDSIDVTDEIHKDFEEIAISAVKAIPGITYAGVDFIAKTLSEKPNSSNHIVSEIEFSPAPIAQFPYEGKYRDIAGELLEYYLNQRR